MPGSLGQTRDKCTARDKQVMQANRTVHHLSVGNQPNHHTNTNAYFRKGGCQGCLFFNGCLLLNRPPLHDATGVTVKSTQYDSSSPDGQSWLHSQTENDDTSVPSVQWNCRDSAICVNLESVCDAIIDCPFRDDEYFCNMFPENCPVDCSCQLFNIICTSWNLYFREVIG